jgi:hypothetical protein
MTMRMSAPFVATVLLVSPVASQEPNSGKVIDFASDSTDDWFVVNDGVMGGRSSSVIRNGEDDFAVFEGYVSLENNGGFASVRREIPTAALDGSSRVMLRVRGDGKQYQLRLRPNRRFDGIAYGAGFETTAGQWTTVEIPFRSFEPTYRGYRPPGVGPLDPSEIGQIGVMAADKHEGPFRLEIEWIGVDR